MAAIARHEFDNEHSVHLGSVHGVRQGATSVQTYVHIPVCLVTELGDGPGYGPARCENVQPVRVVNAGEDINGRPTRRLLARLPGCGSLAAGVKR